MKTKLVLTVILIFFLFLTGCSNNDDNAQNSETLSKSSPALKGSSAITNTFSQAQTEVIETFGEIAKSIKDGDMDKLISFHGYGPKFTEFKNGQLRNGGAENEIYERQLFGELVTNVVRFAAKDLKVAVYYGNVANVTFLSDFIFTFGDDPTEVHVNNQITLLFVKVNGNWKMVHEHHSPLDVPLPV